MDIKDFTREYESPSHNWIVYILVDINLIVSANGPERVNISLKQPIIAYNISTGLYNNILKARLFGKEGDVLEIEFDWNERKLHFIVNGTDLGNALINRYGKVVDLSLGQNKISIGSMSNGECNIEGLKTKTPRMKLW